MARMCNLCKIMRQITNYCPERPSILYFSGVCVCPEVFLVRVPKHSFMLVTLAAVIQACERAKLCFYLPLPLALFGEAHVFVYVSV